MARPTTFGFEGVHWVETHHVPVNPALRGPAHKPTATFPDFDAASVVRDLIAVLPDHVDHALTVTTPPLILRCLTCNVWIILTDAETPPTVRPDGE